MAAYGGASRAQRRYQGVPLPPPLYGRVLELLRALRWPAQNQRAGLSSERCERARGATVAKNRVESNTGPAGNGP